MHAGPLGPYKWVVSRAHNSIFPRHAPSLVLPVASLFSVQHPWAQHTQVEVYRGSGGDMAAMMRSAAADVNRWDLLRRGADEPQDGGSNGGGSGRSGGSSSGVGVA